MTLSYPIGAAAAAYQLGDTDKDGEVNITDATVIQRVLAEMIEDTDGHILRYGDIDGGGLTVMDVSFIQRYLANIDDGYPIGSSVDEPLPTETETAPEVINGMVTVDGVSFDVSDIPDTLVIDSSQSTVSRTLLLIPDRTLAPEDIYIQVNNGSYDLSLKNFALISEGESVPVGNIEVTGVTGTDEYGYTTIIYNESVLITAGDDPQYDYWLGPMLGEVPLELTSRFTDTALNATIDIALGDMIIAVDLFGVAPAEEPIEGDVNHDGDVNIGDINAVIKIILGN